jgi:hypothetical protein
MTTESRVTSESRTNVEDVSPAILDELRTAFRIDGTHPISKPFPAGGTRAALGWPAVRAFEERHAVVLPEPYRSFVAEVSDGSRAGPPDYGLTALAEMPGDGAPGRLGRDLARPFPLTGAWYWEADDRPQAEIGPLIAAVTGHGSIVLGTDGCGMNWHLIVTGPQRGHIWLITGECAAPFGVDTGDLALPGRPGFLGWVRRWRSGEPWFGPPS